MQMVSFKFINLNRGFRAKVSVDDYEWLRHYNWYVDVEDHTEYAKTTVLKPQPDGSHKRSTMRMHRLITRAPPELHVDHINNRGLDNRRENLRVVHPFENNQNRIYGKVSYRGVTVVKRKGGKKYRAQIKNPRTEQSEHLGYFTDPARAAKAYDIRALELYGQFYGLNFPRETYGLDKAITHPQPDLLSDIPF